jgi:hypothetical protein
MTTKLKSVTKDVKDLLVESTNFELMHPTANAPKGFTWTEGNAKFVILMAVNKSRGTRWNVELYGQRIRPQKSNTHVIVVENQGFYEQLSKNETNTRFIALIKEIQTAGGLVNLLGETWKVRNETSDKYIMDLMAAMKENDADA